MKSLRPEWIIALIVRYYANGATIEEISEKIPILRNEGIDTSRIRVRKSPRGYYSEDVHQFVSDLFFSGFAKELSPHIVLKKDGIQLCDEIIQDFRNSNPKLAEKIANVLNIDLNRSSSST